jgi:hypothetical protein
LFSDSEQTSCNEADGTYAEEDIRNGVYWTRFELTKGEWIPVPADVLIKDPNRNGAPVAWWCFQDGKLQIRCYAPGWRCLMKRCDEHRPGRRLTATRFSEPTRSGPSCVSATPQLKRE